MRGEWSMAGDVLRASIGSGQVVAEYHDGTQLPVTESPRPYLHEVRSLGGATVTEAHPADHPHHLGASVAVPDVDGVSYWGGRTFVRDLGPRLLPNHGIQERAAVAVRGGCVTELLHWRAPTGTHQLVERREIHARAVSFAGRRAVSVGLRSRISAAGVLAVSIGSPATNGRAGAGYGGPFWRLPRRPGSRLLTPDGEGEESAHGRRAEWVAVVADEVSVVFQQPGVQRSWFVRAEEYLGVGASLALSRRVLVSPGKPLQTGLTALVVDGPVRADEVRQALSGVADHRRGDDGGAAVPA